MPAIYNLFLDGWAPGHFAIIGLDLKDLSNEEFRKHLHEGVNRFSRRGKAKSEKWKKFEKCLQFEKQDFTSPATYKGLKKKIEKLEESWGSPVSRVFYLATPPALIEEIAGRIGAAGLAEDKKRSRIVVEKPFGHSLESARHLNEKLGEIFDECQIYRIDHYLGKETIQNILAFRFANALFEPVWNRNYIDHIQITVSESLGVENRGSYYDDAGALRDMIQNHIMQLLCLIAMEPPVSFDANEVRSKKVDVLRALRKFGRNEVQKYAVRGQYGEGWMKGEKVKGYRQEPGVDENSNTETFAAVRFLIDNWRWQDVPFYVRTGKRMHEKISVITIQFRPVPHQSFPAEATENWQPNRLVLNIQPQKGIRLRFQAKLPGLKMLLGPVDMLFNYSQSYSEPPPEAYEALLLDIMLGDATLFMRADQVEAAWAALMPIINFWKAHSPNDFPNYDAGMQGPEEADALIAKDGHSWLVLPMEE